MKITLNDSINLLENEIKEKQNLLSLLKNFDVKNKISETEWHDLCKTSLRDSFILENLVSNIFPEAKKITLRPNYVQFELYDFICAIPTTSGEFINVDINWYEIDKGEPSDPYSYQSKKMKEYFELEKNNENWFELLNLRMPRRYFQKNINSYLYWIFYVKNSKIDRDMWNKQFLEEEENLKSCILKYKEERKLIHKKTEIFINKLIPELLKFTNKINYSKNLTYSSSMDYFNISTLDDLKKLENIK